MVVLVGFEPTDVAVKLYMKKHVNTSGADGDDERLNDNIVLTIMSQKDLGPRVYGIFAGGNIQAFHKVLPLEPISSLA